MLYKFYVANIMHEGADGNLELVGSRIIRVWFWENPVVAYNKLGKGGRIPVDVRRIK